VARLAIDDRDRGAWTFFADDAEVPRQGPRVVIVAGGSSPSEERLRSEAARSDVLVCADGGVRAAWAAGLVPSLVVGDLDSAPAWTRERLPAASMHLDARLDRNDLEKAIEQAYARWGAEAEIAIFGAGADQGRSDHALANLGVLLAEPHRRIQWIDDSGRMVALRGGKLVVDDAVGALVSVLPWSLHGSVVSEVGVHYPLDEERLFLGGRGLSNEVGDETAALEVHEGVALIWIGV
jgi:thiamine pyrophosphokinase